MSDTELIAAARKLVKAKGRFHTEQNYMALVAALDAHDVAVDSSAAVPDALPPLPDHPDPHSMMWTEREKAAILAYGKAVARAAVEADRARVNSPEFEGIKANRAQQGALVACLRCEGRGHYAMFTGSMDNEVINGKCPECKGGGKVIATKAAAPADEGRIPVPRSLNMAKGMVALGCAWLKEHAPEHLRAAPIPDTGIPTAGEVGEAADMLLAAAQAIVNEALDDAESRVHPCDVNDDDAKARAMPQPIHALYHAIKAARSATPSHPLEAKAGEGA